MNNEKWGVGSKENESAFDRVKVANLEESIRNKITYSMAYDVDWNKEIKVGGKVLTFEEKVLYSNAYVSGLKKAMEIIEQEILTLCE